MARGDGAARKQPGAAAGHDQHVQRAGLFQQLLGGGALSRHDVRVIERRYGHHAPLGGEALRDDLAVLVLAIGHHLGAVAARRLDLRARRVRRHEDRRARAQQVRGERDHDGQDHDRSPQSRSTPERHRRLRPRNNRGCRGEISLSVSHMRGAGNVSFPQQPCHGGQGRESRHLTDVVTPSSPEAESMPTLDPGRQTLSPSGLLWATRSVRWLRMARRLGEGTIEP